MSRRKKLLPDVPPLSPLPPPRAPLPAAWRWATALLVCAYVGLTLGHLYAGPPSFPFAHGATSAPPPNYINAPDEAAHRDYVRAVAQGRLPSREETYEWHQPPLYYALAAPLYDFGPRAVRWLSLALGLAGLWLVYRAARLLFPDDPVLAVFALGFAALLPMRHAITAVAGNDPLIEAAFSLVLLMVVHAFRSGFTFRRAGFLGLALGTALLTKATGLLLLPVALAALVLLRFEGEKPADLVRGGLWMLLVAAALAAPWYARNYRLYGEFTPVRAFMREFEGTAKARDFLGGPMVYESVFTGQPVVVERMERADYLRWVGDWTFGTFWAAWTRPRDAGIGRPSFLPPNFYWPYVLFVAASLAGLVRLHLRRRQEFTPLQVRVVGLFILAALLVGASFAGFVQTFFQAQGRYLYPALLPLSLLGALGFRAVLPARYRDAACGLVLALFFLLALAFLVAYVVPAYA